MRQPRLQRSTAAEDGTSSYGSFSGARGSRGFSGSTRKVLTTKDLPEAALRFGSIFSHSSLISASILGNADDRRRRPMAPEDASWMDWK